MSMTPQTHNGPVLRADETQRYPDGISVEMRGITKRYNNGVVANDAVDLTLEAGEIHALVGENGAGKSTLMSILSGLEEPNVGEVRLNGEAADLTSPVVASQAGIGMVHQEFKLFPSLTVAENVVFRSELTKATIFLNRKAAERRVAGLSERFGLQVNPKAYAHQLSVGVLQRVEILKALHRDAKVLILDEPTAVLTPQEVDGLFAVLRQLRDSGRTIVVVTHKLREVMQFSDRITVLRDGKAVATTKTADTSPAEIARHMTGRDVDLDGKYQPGQPAEVALEITGLTVRNSDGVTVVKDAALQVRHGEIVGIAGVAGSGQTELLEAISGSAARMTGQICLEGQDLGVTTAAERRQRGIAYIPEDRRGVGSAVAASVSDNLAMGFHRNAPIKKGWKLDRSAMKQHAEAIIRDFEIKVPRPSVEAGTLSGGNLQKVIVGREMTHDAAVLLVDQPTRGVDIGAIENIHARLREYRSSGNAILLVSAELSELFALSDRILVMCDGRIVQEFMRTDATEAKVGLAMTGIQSSETDPSTEKEC